MQRYLYLVLLLAMAMSLAVTGTRADEIRIGFASALTGPYATTGEHNRIAVELAAEDLNRAGGVLGRPIQVITVDDGCDLDQAVTVAQQLVEAGVRFVVGHLCSHASLMAAPIYEAANIPMMTTTASHPRLTEVGRDNVFRLIGRSDRQGRLAGDLLAARWRDRKIALLHDGSDYGAGLAAAVRQRLDERGVSVALDTAYTPGQEDYSALAQQLRQAGITVAYVGGYGPDAARILRAARAHADGLQLIGGHALGMAEFWAMAGPAGEGTIFTARSDTGLLPKEAPILTALRGRGVDANPSSVAAYAAVQVWAQAVRRVGTLDLASVLKELHYGRFNTVIGSVVFDAKGDLSGADWQWQVWRHGRRELLNPALATE